MELNIIYFVDKVCYYISSCLKDVNIMDNVINSIKGVSGINNEYLVLIIVSIFIMVVIKIFNKLINKMYCINKHSSRNVFKFNQRSNILANIVIILMIFLLWEGHLKNIITIISFVSAGATIALREVILNLIAGFYIKFSKPFVVEDRIEIDEVKGDVILINAMSFKVLELENRLNGEQSSGIIVNIPNSKIFQKSLRNYTTAFKYIWSELVVKLNFSANIEKNKKRLYELVKKNEVVKSIPKKMDKAIDEACGSYRIYYNNLEPIIYTEFKEGHIEMTIRFLVHPKKERNVINDLWVGIIKEAQKNNIDLYKEN